MHRCLSGAEDAFNEKRTLLSLAMGAAFPWLAGRRWRSLRTPGCPGGQQERVKSLGVVTVTGGQPTSLPTQIPTTMEGVTREEIETRINATDSEDALKYFPSLFVRKRYIGDYNHAILSSRASGTGNSARSAVYADGILLSNYLGNGIAKAPTFAPRWGLVTPEEIERVDVMYGPFSAAYPGNSAGAVVDYVTRMPTQLEAHVKLGLFVAAFRALQHAPDLQQLADQRLARQQERRLVVVDRRQPHRQPGPAADLHHAPPWPRAPPARRARR